MKQSGGGAASRQVGLLVEDDGNDAVLIRRAAERSGSVQRLLVLSAGEQALAYLEGDLRYADRQQYPLPDVLLLDHYMPVLSGLDVLLWIRSSPRFEHLPVVVLSSDLSKAKLEAVALLKAAYCPKDSAFADLPEAIAQATALVDSASHHLWPPFPEGKRLKSLGSVLVQCASH